MNTVLFGPATLAELQCAIRHLTGPQINLESALLNIRGSARSAPGAVPVKIHDSVRLDLVNELFEAESDPKVRDENVERVRTQLTWFCAQHESP